MLRGLIADFKVQGMKQPFYSMRESQGLMRLLMLTS
jgi:hypothetical protein